MPGDDLVADPRLQFTQAITVRAPAERIWPWLVPVDRSDSSSGTPPGLLPMLVGRQAPRCTTGVAW